jgi:hypothetical protein
VRTQLANGRTQASLSVPNASGSAVGTNGKKKLELYLQVEISTWQYNFLLKSADDGGVHVSG